MLYMLKIGYHQFLLPNDTGLSTVLRVMANARQVAVDKRYKGGGLELDAEPVKCSIEVLPDFRFVKRPTSTQATATVIEPEVLPPHVNALARSHRRQLMLGSLTEAR